jgi:predicted Zn finger-like uncharacterized protein
MPSLAARCTACGTVFRVVQDQLRVAGGLVRCGRCGEVFNASAALIDLDTGALPPPIALPALPALPAVEAMPAPAAAAPIAVTAAPALDFGAIDSAAGAERPAVEALRLSMPAATGSTGAGPAPEPEDQADLRAEADAMPSFVRSAERAQRWRRPRVRAALVATIALAAVGLSAQLAHSWRDLLAARFPGARPALEAACAAWGCRVEAVRAIDKLAVESSGLVRVEKSSVYRLQLALRNRGDIPLAWPAFDLTLSDSTGKPVARRVLRAADLGVNEATLAAGRELALQATLQAATEPVVGYTIELFYP